MKILIVIGLMLAVQPANAQLWKKIKKKTERKVGNVIANKASDKAAEIVAKNMDKLLNENISLFGEETQKKDVSDLPKSYSFNRKYKMEIEMQGQEKKMSIDYYLTTTNSYVGFSMPQMPSMLTVFDRNKHAMVAYMDQGDQPIAMAYTLPEDTTKKQTDELKDYTIKKLPGKKIIGFNCKGLLMENAQYKITMYYTTEAGVSLYGALKSNKISVPPQLKNYVSDSSKGLLTYMKVIDKQDQSRNLTMNGISLTKVSVTKTNAHYRFM